MMEPLVYLLVTATTLTRHLAYLRQTMAMLHVAYASISILLDMGGARLIRDLRFGKQQKKLVISISKWNSYII